MAILSSQGEGTDLVQEFLAELSDDADPPRYPRLADRSRRVMTPPRSLIPVQAVSDLVTPGHDDAQVCRSSPPESDRSAPGGARYRPDYCNSTGQGTRSPTSR